MSAKKFGEIPTGQVFMFEGRAMRKIMPIHVNGGEVNADNFGDELWFFEETDEVTVY